MHFTCETTQPGWGLSQRSQKWDLRSTCTVKHELCKRALSLLWRLERCLEWTPSTVVGTSLSCWRREATEKINGQGRYIPKQYIMCLIFPARCSHIHTDGALQTSRTQRYIFAIWLSRPLQCSLGKKQTMITVSLKFSNGVYLWLEYSLYLGVERKGRYLQHHSQQDDYKSDDQVFHRSWNRNIILYTQLKSRQWVWIQFSCFLILIMALSG